MKVHKKRRNEAVCVVKTSREAKNKEMPKQSVAETDENKSSKAVKRKNLVQENGPEKKVKKLNSGKSQKQQGLWKNKDGKMFFHGEKFEKPDWNKIKSEKQKLKVARKSSKTQFSTFHEIKSIWEKLRRHDCRADERNKLCVDLMKLVEGNLLAVIRSHDISRVVQTLVQFGTNEMRIKIVDEIINDILSLAQCKYSVHLVQCLFRYSPSSARRNIAAKLCGPVLKLVRSKISCKLADEIYTKYATSEEKAKMKKEFYGNLLNTNEDNSLSALDDHDDTKKAVLSTTKNILRKLTDKANCLGSRLVQSVLYDFLINCSEVDKAEMLNDLKPHLGMLLQSREGALVAGLVLRQSSNKEKKTFVKELKNKPLNDCHCLVLMTLFDTVDDTVLLKKALIPEILNHLEEYIKYTSGQKVVLYLVAHRDSHFLHPRDIEWLKESETSSSAKKDPEVRFRELQEAVIKPVTEFISNNPKLCFSSPDICMFTLAVVRKLSGDFLKDVHESLSSYIIKQSIEKTDFPNIVENAGVSSFLTQLLHYERSKEKESSFAKCLLDKMTQEVILEWIKVNRGRFALINTIESDVDTAKELLKSQIDSGIEKILEGFSESKSARILTDILKTNQLLK